MSRTILLSFDTSEDGLCSWIEKIGSSSIKKILEAVRLSTESITGGSNILDVIKDGIASSFPSQNIIELEKLQERNRAVAECQTRLNSKQDLVESLQTQVKELQQDVIINRGKLEQFEHVNDKILLQKELEWRDNTRSDGKSISDIEAALQRIISTSPISMNFDNIRELIEGPLRKVERYVDKFDTKCSVDKGRAMEDKYYRLLETQLPEYEIDLVRDTAHEMDLKVTNGSHSVLIDIKNYTHNVTTKEVIKFETDVRTNKIPSILISSMSGVANKKHFQIDFVDSRYPVCYLSNVKEDVFQVLSAITIVGSLEKFAMSQSTGVRLDSGAVKKINDKLHQVSATLKEMSELNEQQKRLIRKVHMSDIVDLVCGHLAGATDNHLDDFIRQFVVKSSEEAGRFNLRDATRLWKVNSERFGNPPKKEVFKKALETGLRSICISKRSLEGIIEYNVFLGWTLRESAPPGS